MKLVVILIIPLFSFSFSFSFISTCDRHICIHINFSLIIALGPYTRVHISNTIARVATIIVHLLADGFSIDAVFELPCQKDKSQSHTHTHKHTIGERVVDSGRD